MLRGKGVTGGGPKRPIGQKTYKEKEKEEKSKGPTVRTLTTASNTRISIPLTKEEEERQLREMLQRCIVEKRAPHVPHLKNVGPSGLELQRMALEEAMMRKTRIETARARGEGTSAQ